MGYHRITWDTIGYHENIMGYHGIPRRQKTYFRAKTKTAFFIFLDENAVKKLLQRKNFTEKKFRGTKISRKNNFGEKKLHEKNILRKKNFAEKKFHGKKLGKKNFTE